MSHGIQLRNVTHVRRVGSRCCYNCAQWYGADGKCYYCYEGVLSLSGVEQDIDSLFHLCRPAVEEQELQPLGNTTVPPKDEVCLPATFHSLSPLTSLSGDRERPYEPRPYDGRYDGRGADYDDRRRGGGRYDDDRDRDRDRRPSRLDDRDRDYGRGDRYERYDR